jgi:Rad3-related DNA helicase
MNNYLGQTLHNVIKNIPGGVLVFFPCYKMIEEVVTTWKVCLFDINMYFDKQILCFRKKNRIMLHLKQ